MRRKDESDIEPSYRVVCSISPEKNRSRNLSPDNIAAGYYYTPNTISNLTNPDASGCMVQTGNLQLISPGTALTGKNPRFSNEFGLAATTGYKRGDMLINASDATDKLLLLTPGGNSGICLRSNTPGA